MRSGWKPNYIDSGLREAVVSMRKAKKTQPIHVFSRSSTIVPSFIGRKVMVHQGKDFVKFTVKDYMLGHKFGEYAPTRKVGLDMHFRKKGKKGNAPTTGRKK
jgi:small subunit ribosomal protein S19